MNGSVEFSSSVNNVAKQETTSSSSPHRNFNNNRYDGSNNQQRSNCGSCGSRGRGRSYGGRPHCQVCGNPCHTALSCKNRFNHAYQSEEYRGSHNATSWKYNNDQNLYVDTGATKHLTSDLARLTMQDCYHGKDQV